MATILVGAGAQALTLSHSLAGRKRLAEEVDHGIRRELLAFVRPLVAPAAFYALYGQVTLWGLSLMGGVADLAGLGALGRVVQVLAVFTVTIQMAVHPHFARERDNQKLTKDATLLAMALTVGGAVVVGSSYVFCDLYLLFLGSKYSDLGSVLWIGMLTASLILIDSALYGCSLAVGRSAYQWLTIPAHLVGLVAGSAVSFPNSLKSAVLFDFIRVLPALIVQVAIFVYTFYVFLPRRAIAYGNAGVGRE